MKVKQDVDLAGVQPEMAVAALIIYTVFLRHGYSARVTSVRDGLHKVGSLHYRGLAMDWGIDSIPKDELTPFCAELKEALGPQFDVVQESDHIHTEFDPKNDR
jgi:hypothetical protein